MSNIDPRKVCRGKCLKCDCEGYKFEPDSGRAACYYCECPPPAHEKIEQVEQTLGDLPVTQSIQVVTNSNIQIGTSSICVSITPHKPLPPKPELPQLVIVPHARDMANNPVMRDGNVADGKSVGVIYLDPEKNLLEDILVNAEEEINSDDVQLPNVLPDYVQAALDAKVLDAKHRSAICRAVMHKSIDEGKATNKHLTVLARKIRQKWSPMKQRTDPNGLALYKKLARTRSRMNNPDPKRINKSATAAMSEKEAQAAMVGDWAANKRSVTVMAPYLAATRNMRNKEAKKCKSLDLLIKFPALTINQLLLKEFSEMDDVKVPLLAMKENWLRNLPYLTKHLREQSIYNIGDDFSVQQQTVMVLENLHRVPFFTKGRTKKSNEERSCRVLEIFPENTPIGEARPNSKDPLRLSAIGQAMGRCSFFAYSDSEPIFSTEDSIEAILLLLATYWVFHLNFGTSNKLPILFLAACTLGPVTIKNYVARNEKFLDFCRDKFHMTV